MQGTGVIDRFLDVFTRYIDSGFGLLQGEVAWLASTLIVIDVTLAALFWAWGADEDILARLVKKTLFVGAFAFILGNWNNLARIVFESFSGLGLKASGTSLSAAEFLQPGRVAQVGFDAGRPILESISGMMGYISFFENFIQIAVLLFAWGVVMLSFFVLAIQLFISLIEFKLATLCGFVLVPFGLFNKTAFMAERVLGLVISSGVKMLVLAVVVGIGSTLFDEFTAGFAAEPTIEDAMALVLGALSLLSLGIYAPGIANGIVSGGPQLGAGAAVGTGLAAGGAAMATAGAARMVGGAAVGAVRGGASVVGGASRAGGASPTGTGGGSPTPRAEPSGGGGAAPAASPLRPIALEQRGPVSQLGGSAPLADTGPSGSTAETGSGEAAPSADAPANDSDKSGEPGWARRARRGRSLKEGAMLAAHAVRSGDGGGSGSSINLSEDR